MTNEDIMALYYALEKAYRDLIGFGLSSATDRICFYMNYKDYGRICGFLSSVIAYDDGKRTLFGHEIKIRDDIKHIYLGIEIDEVAEK